MRCALSVLLRGLSCPHQLTGVSCIDGDGMSDEEARQQALETQGDVLVLRWGEGFGEKVDGDPQEALEECKAAWFPIEKTKYEQKLLDFHESFEKDVLLGRKRATTRWMQYEPELDAEHLVDGMRLLGTTENRCRVFALIRVVSVSTYAWKDLKHDAAIAHQDGFKTVEAYQDAIYFFYGQRGIQDNTQLHFIEFDVQHMVSKSFLEPRAAAT